MALRYASPAPTSDDSPDLAGTEAVRVPGRRADLNNEPVLSRNRSRHDGPWRRWRHRLAVPIVSAGRELALLARRAAGHRGRAPDFLIIGAQKAATTSLYAYLCQHPQVQAALTKEIHYFDHYLPRGFDWYCRHFPANGKTPEGLPLITGEASPYYLVHPAVPDRVQEALPGVRLIVLLRDPVARAISHYEHEFRRGFERLPFLEALEAEERRIAGEAERLVQEPAYRSYAFEHHTYKTRGRYAEQLSRWIPRFGRERMLVLQMEELESTPGIVLGRVAAFLGIEPWSPDTTARHNPGSYGRVPSDALGLLRAYFEPLQGELAALLQDESWHARSAERA